jgi:transposase
MKLYMGIDIAKRSHTAVVLNAKGEVVVKTLAFDNNRAGIDQMLACLAGFELPVEIALESTGHYWLAVYEQLAEAGYRVHVLNPIQIRNFSRSGIRKRKNDRLDAQWIAEYLRVYEGQLDEMYFNTHLQLRRLSRFRLNLSDQIGDAKRRIVGLLDIVFPEYEQFFSDTLIQSSRQMLAKALAPQEFADFDLTELAQLLRRASHGYYGEAKAREIQGIAQQSVGSSFLLQAARVEMDCLLAQLTFFEAQIDTVDAALAELVETVPDTYLTTIPGIGTTAAAIILGEIGDVRRFEAVEQLIAYAGIDPTVYQSGEFEGNQAHMSKRGSPHLRRILWLAATMARIKDPELKAFYRKKRAEGKCYGTAMGAVCRKLLARIYVVLRDKRPYIIREMAAQPAAIPA